MADIKELEIGMGRWDDIKSVDDLVLPGDARIIIEAERECRDKCPFFRGYGHAFRFCSAGIPDGTMPKADPLNPVVQSKLGPIEIQLYCLDAYRRCAIYTGDIPSRGGNPTIQG